MSSRIVLLNEDGTVAKKLALVSLPENYEVPAGKIVSWQLEFEWSTQDATIAEERPDWPIEAFFYHKEAWARVICKDTRAYNGSFFSYIRDIQITVQGSSAKDVMYLRDHIMSDVHLRLRWFAGNQVK